MHIDRKCVTVAQITPWAAFMKRYFSDFYSVLIPVSFRLPKPHVKNRVNVLCYLSVSPHVYVPLFFFYDYSKELKMARTLWQCNVNGKTNTPSFLCQRKGWFIDDLFNDLPHLNFTEAHVLGFFRSVRQNVQIWKQIDTHRMDVLYECIRNCLSNDQCLNLFMLLKIVTEMKDTPYLCHLLKASPWILSVTPIGYMFCVIKLL